MERLEWKTSQNLLSLPISLLYNNVDVNPVVNFLTNDAWTRVLKLAAQKKVYDFVSLKG